MLLSFALAFVSHAPWPSLAELLHCGRHHCPSCLIGRLSRVASTTDTNYDKQSGVALPLAIGSHEGSHPSLAVNRFS